MVLSKNANLPINLLPLSMIPKPSSQSVIGNIIQFYRLYSTFPPSSPPPSVALLPMDQKSFVSPTVGLTRQGRGKTQGC